jgi:hypothetical protein
VHVFDAPIVDYHQDFLIASRCAYVPTRDPPWWVGTIANRCGCAQAQPSHNLREKDVVAQRNSPGTGKIQAGGEAREKLQVAPGMLNGFHKGPFRVKSVCLAPLLQLTILDEPGPNKGDLRTF